MSYLLLVLFSISVSHAWDDSVFVTEQAHSKAAIISERESLAPGENRLGFLVKLEKDWHTYWENPGDSAAPPIFEFELPEGVNFEGITYVIPKRIQVGPLYSFGYEDLALYFLNLRVDKELIGTQVDATVDVEWLVCKEECIPGFYEFPLQFNVERSSEYSEFKELFDSFEKRIPKKLSEKGEFDIRNNYLKVDFPNSIDSQNVLDLFPYSNELISNLPFDTETLTVGMSENANLLLNSQKVLVLTESGGVTVEIEKKQQSLFLVALLAFFGGLILNLMPCVFPILSLKVFSVLGAKSVDKVQNLKDQMGYSVGVWISFLALGGSILALRASGNLVGWGFQLQSPIIISILILVFVVLGLIHLGFFEFSFYKVVNKASEVQTKGRIKSFMTGLLAVVVASPCTAPFMGFAIGYALDQGVLEVGSIFFALGFGFAFPFTLLGVFPRALFFLPKPGPWLGTFKKVMSLPLFATAVWLGWILYLQVGVNEVDLGDRWVKFTPEALQNEINDGNAVFVNFTAAWCITCKANEKVALNSETVLEYFTSNEITLMKGDWTKKDEAIARVLREHGRAGVPLYLYYPKGEKQPVVLPEILTPDLLISTLSEPQN